MHYPVLFLSWSTDQAEPVESCIRAGMQASGPTSTCRQIALILSGSVDTDGPSGGQGCLLPKAPTRLSKQL